MTEAQGKSQKWGGGEVEIVRARGLEVYFKIVSLT